MLSRDRRLHPRSRVRATIRHGRRVRAGQVVLHHLADEDAPRACVVAGKAVGNAVQRHQRQRQLRHLLADLWDELPTGSLVVRALPGEHAGLQADLRRAVRRL